MPLGSCIGRPVSLGSCLPNPGPARSGLSILCVDCPHGIVVADVIPDAFGKQRRLAAIFPAYEFHLSTPSSLLTLIIPFGWLLTQSAPSTNRPKGRGIKPQWSYAPNNQKREISKSTSIYTCIGLNTTSSSICVFLFPVFKWDILPTVKYPINKKSPMER